MLIEYLNTADQAEVLEEINADEIKLILDFEDEYEVEQWKAVEGEENDAAEVEAMRRDLAEDEKNAGKGEAEEEEEDLILQIKEEDAEDESELDLNVAAEDDVAEIASQKRKLENAAIEVDNAKKRKLSGVQDIATEAAEIDPAQRFENMMRSNQMIKFQKDCSEPNIILNLFGDENKDITSEVEDLDFTEEQDDELIMQLVAEEEDAAAETNWQFKMVTAMKEAEHAAKEEAENRKDDIMIAEADSSTEQFSGESEGMEWKAEQFEVVNSDRKIRFQQECIASLNHTLYMIVEDGRKLRENCLLKQFYSKFLDEL